MTSALSSRRTLLYFWLPIALLLGLAGGYLYNTRFCSASISKRVGDELGLYFTMRKLWADHVFWMRNYLMSAISDKSNTQLVAKRLLKNQDDIGSAFGQFYGSAVGKALADLLKEHILIMVDLVSSVRLNNSSELKELDDKWHKNADDIAKALSDLNPSWPYKTIQKMLYEHLDLTHQEISAMLKKDWSADIAAFDKAFEQILEMAVDFAQGIISQFPARF